MNLEEAKAFLAVRPHEPALEAVLVVLRHQRELYVRALSSQARAESPGKLTHAAGSIYALDTLDATLGAMAPRTPPPAE